MRLATGTAQSSKITALVGCEFQPIYNEHVGGHKVYCHASSLTFFSLAPKLIPGVPFSTIKHVTPFGPLGIQYNGKMHITIYAYVHMVI